MRAYRKKNSMAERDENSTERWESRRLLMTAVALIVVQLLIAAVAYAMLPARVPVHWNASGQVDSYGPKLEALLFPPLLSLVVLVLVRVVVTFGPYPGRENRGIAVRFTDYVLIAVILLMQLIQLVTIAVALHVPIDATSIIFVAVSLFLIGLGNYMSKLRRNAYVGIRTPWTISNDTVWERTHRLGSWLFVIAGIIGLLTALIPIPSIRLAGLLVPLFLVTLITVVYSYIEYQKVVVNRDRPRPL